MSAAQLYEAPFTDFSPRGVEGVFDSAQVTQLLSILDGIRQAAAWAVILGGTSEAISAAILHEAPPSPLSLNPILPTKLEENLLPFTQARPVTSPRAASKWSQGHVLTSVRCR
jgi:hypothetical protein